MTSIFSYQIYHNLRTNFHLQGSCLRCRKLSQFVSLSQKVETVPQTLEKPLSSQADEMPQGHLKGEILQNSLRHPDFFGLAELFSVENLFQSNVHLGHRIGTLSSYMKPYIFGSRLGHLIIDLDQTCVLLRYALNFTAHIAFRKGIILFVGRNPQHQLLIEKAAQKCKEYSHTRPWESRTFTGASKFLDKGVRLPDLLILLNTKNDVVAEHPAVKDAARMLIPTVGIVDTNCDPRLISYPVPGNDDSSSAIRLYLHLFTEAVLLGKQKRQDLLKDT